MRNKHGAISPANAAPSTLLRRALNVCLRLFSNFFVLFFFSFSLFFLCFIKSLLLLYIGTFKSAHLDALSLRPRFDAPFPPIPPPLPPLRLVYHSPSYIHSSLSPSRNCEASYTGVDPPDSTMISIKKNLEKSFLNQTCKRLCLIKTA